MLGNSGLFHGTLGDKIDKGEPELVTNVNFGSAIEYVRNGGRAKRRGWNGKSQYIELATCISYKNAKGEVVNVDHEAIGNSAIAFVGTSGVQLGWLASQADMLANDWVLLNAEVM